MKYAKLFVPTFLALAGMVFFTNCVDDTYHIASPVPYFGQVAVTPNSVKTGDTIQLSMRPLTVAWGVEVSTSPNRNGENLIQSISYYIDGAFVAESSDSLNNYVATYEISDISAGTHEVTAHCTPPAPFIHKIKDATLYEDITINEHIEACTLTIEE